MELFSKEINDMNELKEVLKANNNISKEYEVAVIAYVFDKENKIIFQRRGPGCRDEILKLETIGGRVKDCDINFRTALYREILEEVGSDANIEIEEFITSTYAKTFDLRSNKEQEWIYLVYKGNLKSGNIHITEPTKNLGYERYKIGEVDENELSNGAKELYNIVSKKYKSLK
ncbi:MAG: NUDIX hydrolase [Clostridia bacterium]|nr:NUDIX hydrolase [Clostridia bacterium]